MDFFQGWWDWQRFFEPLLKLSGALGAAVGYAEIEIAVLLSAFNYLALRALAPLGERFDGPSDPGAAAGILRLA